MRQPADGKTRSLTRKQRMENLGAFLAFLEGWNHVRARDFFFLLDTMKIRLRTVRRKEKDKNGRIVAHTHSHTWGKVVWNETTHINAKLKYILPIVNTPTRPYSSLYLLVPSRLVAGRIVLMWEVKCKGKLKRRRKSPAVGNLSTHSFMVSCAVLGRH